MSNPKKYLDQLFISKVRVKALHHFFTNPDKPIHLRGAVRELDEEINAVRRELERMEEIRLLVGEKQGNRKYFHINPNFVFYDELAGIMYKSFGLGGEIVTNERKLGEIDYALLTQRFVYKKDFGTHKVDLVVVGEVDLKALDAMVTKEEQRSKSQIHYTVLSRSDFELRRRRRDAFVLELLTQDTLMLIGNKREFIDS